MLSIKFYLLLISFISGAISVLGFAPYHYAFLLIISLSLFFFVLQCSSTKQAFWQGYFYGLGLMGFGVFWLRISFDEFNHLGSFLSTLLVFGFIFSIAFYFAFIAFFCRLFSQGNLWIIGFIWVLGEALRSWFLTGFPWLSIGYAFIDTPLAGFAPIFGIYGVSLSVAISAIFICLILLKPRKKTYTFCLLGLWFSGWILYTIEWTQVEKEELKIALFQANIPQQIKWNPEQLVPTLQRHLDMRDNQPDADLIIWAETAIPALLTRVESVLTPLESQLKKQNQAVLTGIPLSKKGQIFNSLLLLGTAQRQFYYKHHLVPFGEFQPLPILQPLIDYFNIPMSNFTQGQTSSVLTLKDFNLGVSICYEDVFSREIQAAMPVADILINVSNDAWFGHSIAPYQHLQMARMRALENGRYFVRATNTGVSAIMNEKGKVLKRLGLLKSGTLIATIPKISGLTPFARYGEYPIWIILIICCFFIRFNFGFESVAK